MPNPKLFSVTRRRLLTGSAQAAVMIGAMHYVPALAQDTSRAVIAQAYDAQPRNLLAFRGGNFPWIKNVFETLTYTDPETFEPQPELATDWTLSDNGMTLTLNLRDDVTFHTGRKMTAADVKYSLETAALPETASQIGFIARSFKAIDTPSDTQVVITFSQPTSNVWDLFEETPIIDKETYAEREDGSKVIGTGPYKFVSWTPGAELQLSRYDDYRDKDAAQIRDLDYAIIADPTATIAAVRSGRAQIGYGMTPRDVIEFDRNPMYTIVSTAGTIYPFGVNVEEGPFDQKTVRQAVGYAIDRQRIIDQVFDGAGTPTDLFWSPSSPGYTEEQANRYSYDPDKASKMLEDAGAKGAKVTIIIPAIPANRSIFEIVQNNLREVGLEPEARVLDVAEYDQRQVAGDLGEAFILIHGQVGFQTATLLSSLPSLRKGNPSHFWSDEYETLRNAVSAASTADDQAKAVTALSEYMLDEAFTLALLQAPSPSVVSADLEGVSFSRRGYILFKNATYR